MAITAVCGGFLATVGYFGFLGGWSFLFVISFVPGVYLKRAWAAIGVPIAYVLVTGLLLPALQPAQEYGGRRSACRNFMRQIGMALDTYHQDYGCYPPAYVADGNGKPMHSWRVLILPYIEEIQLHSEYDFNEPWDGPNNRKLHSGSPYGMQCPSDPACGTGSTSYVAVVGASTMWPGAGSASRQQCPDGLSNTVLLVEVHNSGIHWMEPRDLDITTMSFKVNGPPSTGISSGHPDGAHVLFADGYVGFLPNTLTAGEVGAILTRNGSEQVDPTW
jgi:prepilin-type processing-associated H-X9-DG protein